MPAPTVTFPTTGTDPKTATKAGVEAEINEALEALHDDIQTKAPIDNPSFTGTVSGVTKAMVGLGNADNTSDVNKPVSTAQQAAIDELENRLGPGLPAGPVRPGDVPLAFGNSLTATWATQGDAPGAVVVDTNLGQTLEVTGAGIVAARGAIPVLAGRTYQAYWIFKRVTDSTDPLGDAVVTGVQYLNASQGSNGGYAPAQTATAVQGVRIVGPVSFSLDDLDADVTLPAGTVYVRPYLRTYGTSVVTRVGWIVFEETKDTTVVDANLAALAAAADAAIASAAANETSADRAFIEGNAAGVAVIYANKTAADAGLAALAAGTAIDVSVDETRSGRRTRYRKTGGVYVFEQYLDAAPAIPVADQLRERLRTGRVDFVGIGDSNQIFGGHGWDDAFQYAMSVLGYPMWATGLVSQNEGGGSGSGQGYLYTRSGSLIGATTGAPSELADFLNFVSPASYTYVADGSSTTTSVASGLLLSANCPIDNGAALAFDIWWGSFASGSGAFRPWTRLEQSPFSGLVGLDTINTNTGVLGVMSRATVTLSADPTRVDKAIGGKPIVVGTTGITGPFFMTYYRWRNPVRTTGFSYGTLVFQGGQSARKMAKDLQDASDACLTHYFSILRADQVGSASGLRTVVIWINSALNDRNETLASVGPGAVADGDSAEAFVDNHRAIVERLYEIWDLNGWPQNELFFMFMPSHPVSDPDDAEMLAYRDALEAYSFSVPRAQFINLDRLTDATEMLAQGAYASGGSDRNHLTQVDGYRWLALRALGAIA